MTITSVYVILDSIRVKKYNIYLGTPSTILSISHGAENPITQLFVIQGAAPKMTHF